MVHGLETIKALNDKAVRTVLESPLDSLRDALQADQDYAWTWHCNLACIAMDAGAEHESSNRRAATFMRDAFDVDVTKTDYWKKLEIMWSESSKKWDGDLDFDYDEQDPLAFAQGLLNAALMSVVVLLIAVAILYALFRDT